jgi:hypothetical protein
VDGAERYYTLPNQAQQWNQLNNLLHTGARQYRSHNEEMARQQHHQQDLREQLTLGYNGQNIIRFRGIGPDGGAPFAQVHAAAQQVQDQVHQQIHAQPEQGVGLVQAPVNPRGRAADTGRNPVDVRVQPHAHPANLGAAAVLAAIWPHIWLVIRLAAFVWWFTSSDNSWSRWITVTLIAIAVFVVNTGILNGHANQLWEPIRRHLDALLPLADAHAAPHPQQQPTAARPVANDDNNPLAGQAAQQQANVPDPAQVAARLVAERRENNANWLMDQVRRMERAGLLFLASIAPGVAERHIAHIEAQERAVQAERERIQREAEERARAEAEAAAPAEAADTDTANPHGQNENEPQLPGLPDHGLAPTSLEQHVQPTVETVEDAGEEEPLIEV